MDWFYYRLVLLERVVILHLDEEVTMNVRHVKQEAFVPDGVEIVGNVSRLRLLPWW